MKSIPNFVQAQRGGLRLRSCCWLLLPLLLLAVCLVPSTQAQTVQAANQGGLPLSAGGTVSGYQLGYGQIKILGGTAFVDADTLHHFGVEGEFRMLTFHLKANQNVDENAKTYLAGPRYSRHYGRFQPYVKGLVGIGQFNYPYNYAKETDLVVAGGGGVDYRLTNRIRWRAADFEYQMWPQFTFGRMSSYGLSSGIRIMIR
jgi:hypothetical protein